MLCAVCDAGGRKRFAAPDDDVAYTSYHADVEELLQLEARSLLVVVPLTDEGRDHVLRLRAGSGA